jgi:predicted O-methyltransferase YrrM
MYRTRKVLLADGAERAMDVYIPREQGHLLYSIVRHLDPQTTVEVGMANGLSTLFIAQALRDNGRGGGSRHVAIDPFQRCDWGGAGLTSLRRAGLDSFVRLVEKPSHQGLPQLEQEGVTAQFIFIDGSHLFDYVMTDFLCSDRILDVGGMIAFDDSDWEAVSRVIRFVLSNRRYTLAFPDIVIEDACYRPTALGKLTRTMGKAVPRLAGKLRPDFVLPDYELGIRGRCVVLRKEGPDDRHPLNRFHVDF